MREAQRLWNGCWCRWFHPACAEKGKSPDDNRAYKKRLVRDGNAHAALAFDGDVAVGWCEYGSPDELPDIYHRKEYEAGLESLPDYRLTCFFVPGITGAGGWRPSPSTGAPDLIAQAGGGVAEAYPQNMQGKETSASFLHNGTRSLFEKAGFDYERPKGKGHCVMRKVVPSA